MKALVTGASAGIGRTFATSLAAKGYSVTAVARREDVLAELITELGPGHEYLAADLSTPAGVRATADLLAASEYTLLVNNAAVAVHGDLTTIPIETALTAIDLNCRAVVALAHAFLSNAAADSALVNVSSTLGHTPIPGLSVYSATKAFVTAFSETLWYEQKLRGIHVMALCPGVTATESRGVEDTPSWLVQSAQDVVDRALVAVGDKVGPTVLTNRRNRMLTKGLLLLPRRARLSLLAPG